MKRAIISLANERGNYRKGLARLEASIKEFSTADFIGFTSEEEVGAPKHQDNPYSFKTFAWQEVIRRGYNTALWLDSSVYAIAPVDHLFDHIEKHGYIAQYAGHIVYNWCDQKTYEYFNLGFAEACAMPMYGNAGVLGLDLNNEAALIFIDEWHKASQAGIFKGSWDYFRHDMTCGSIIANRLGWTFQPGDQILQYAAPGTTPQNNTICLYAQGL